MSYLHINTSVYAVILTPQSGIDQQLAAHTNVSMQASVDGIATAFRLVASANRLQCMLFWRDKISGHVHMQNQSVNPKRLVHLSVFDHT